MHQVFKDLPAGSARVAYGASLGLQGFPAAEKYWTWEERFLLASGSLRCFGKQREGRKEFRLTLLEDNLLVFHDLLFLWSKMKKVGR